MHINEVPKFLAESSSEISYAIKLTDPFSEAHLIIILLQLSGVSSYFDVHSPSVAEYENESIFKIHLTPE